MPQIEVTFDIDANGILTVSAKDLDTGKQQSITIDDSGRMSDDEVDRAIRDAEQYAEQDEARRDADAGARGGPAAGTTRPTQALAQKGKQLEKDEKKQIKADVAAVRKLLSKKASKVDEADVAALRAAAAQLERSSARARDLARQA